MSAIVTDLAPAALAGVRVLVAGRSRSELLLAKILADQGAAVRFADVEQSAAADGSGSGSMADILIDADRGKSAGALSVSALQENARAGTICCVFTGLPEAAPGWLSADNEALVAAEVGLNRATPATDNGEAEPLPIPSTYAAIWAAIYIAAALHVRRRKGEGAYIRVPLFSSALTVIGRSLVNLEREELVDPLTLPRTPVADIYECRDGRFVQNHGTFPHFAEILCGEIGHPEWAAEAAAGLTSLSSAAEAESWRARFAAAFLERDALAWEEALNAAGGACTMCRTPGEWRLDGGARTSGIVATGFSGEDAGTGPAVRISADAPASSGPATVPDSAAWPASSSTAEAGGGPLDGLRVLDFCIILAGPTCGRTLAELGADVIKIDSPSRDVSPYGWLDVNRGKRSMLIDLRTAQGQEIVRQLLASADVVLENFRSGKLDSLGLGYEAVRKLRPRIVYGSMNAFDYGGTWNARAGWEHNAQAASGMQVARQIAGRPMAVPVPVNDYATGLLAALGVTLGLLRRDNTGAPARVTASLARTATFLQLGQSQFDAGFSRSPRANASYRTADGQVRVADPATNGGPAQEPPADLTARTTADALAALRRIGVPVAVERMPRDLLAEDWMYSEGLLLSWNHPRWGPLQQGMARLSASAFRASPRWPAPDPGEHTETILAGLGYSPNAIEELGRAGVVSGRRPLFPAHDGKSADG